MNLLKCILTENDCYKTNEWIAVKGVMIHSTGANNPTLKRYVQPLESAPDYDELISLIGYNRNANDWNRPDVGACVHGFIGKLADGSIAAIQTLPWTMRGWHAGDGTTRPSANNTHISFEICEDDLTDPEYFRKVYHEAVELTAYLCAQYHLDPLAPEVVICHSEGYRLGMASGHADVEHWFPRFGKTMDDFRQDVKDEMEGENMSYEKFKEYMEQYEREQELLPPGGWSADSRAWSEGNGMMKGKGDIDGDGEKDFAYKAHITREEAVELFYRYNNLK